MFSLFSYKNPRYDLSLPIFRAARKVSEEVGAQIVLGDHPIEITEPNSDDSTFRLNEQLSFSYPSLLQPLIHKRDTYLALSLKRSKALNNNKKVVGVIGKGQMNGVIYELISDQGNLRFWDLAGKRPDGEIMAPIVVLIVFLRVWLETP
ncbi:hypothetical protein I3760_01G037000 [Carya illinoinensis]|uniref:Uncharacterized protein n=1 Tax=Carya illinoinensis TaxID=32201 RepID=A0A8T1RIJ1_CARIL|nr:hypothetical protein I3760_01G037000 [Carya illinoinensis]KAG6666554.1 hypothetical protein CIPAW_01G039000 [Carya illinoinensis]